MTQRINRKQQTPEQIATILVARWGARSATTHAMKKGWTDVAAAIANQGNAPDPKIIDAELAWLYGASLRLSVRIMDAQKAIQKADEDIAMGLTYTSGWDNSSTPGAWDKVDEMKAQLAHVKREQQKREAIHREYNWSRFFVVPGGHVHKSMHCNSCYPTTMFGWLPEYSGDDSDTIIQQLGTTVCTVCYPDAPVDNDEIVAKAKAAKLAAEGKCANKAWEPTESSASNRLYRYGKCTACGTHASITKTGVLRQHKIEK